MNSRGNVLFLILIAVVLFAALSYAVTQSSRGGGNTTTETAKIQASELMNYVGLVRVAIQRMRASGVSEEDICFASSHSNWGHVSYGTSLAACSDEDGALFYAEGGGVPFMRPKQAWIDPSIPNTYGEYGAFTYTGIVHVVGIGTDGTDDSNPELTFIFPYISKEMCAEVNKMVGLPYNPIPDEDDEFHIGTSGKRFNVSNKYDGDHSWGSIIGDDNTDVVGYDMGCAREGAGAYYFWAVLIER